MTKKNGVRGQIWVHLPTDSVQCYLELKLRYLKYLKLFSMQFCEERPTGFALSVRILVTLGILTTRGYTVKQNIINTKTKTTNRTQQQKQKQTNKETKCKIVKENPFLSVNRLSKNKKCGVQQIITIIRFTRISQVQIGVFRFELKLCRY